MAIETKPTNFTLEVKAKAQTEKIRLLWTIK